MSETFGKVEQRVAKWEEALLKLEVKEEDQLLTENEKNEKQEAQLHLLDALRDEETFWSQKSRNLWKEQGDKCTRLFHMVINSSQESSGLTSLLINYNQWKTRQRSRNM